MLAVQVTGPDRLRVADVPQPDPEGRAVVAVRQVGICGTDLSILDGRVPVDYPRILGHEVVGEVMRPGPEGLAAAGQRVLVDPAISCGRCPLCWEGRSHLCLDGGLLGRDADGVFASHVAVGEHGLVPVPDTIGEAAAGLLQVLGTCVHAQRWARVFPGDVAVVLGLGVSGLLFVQLLRAQGARVVGITRTAGKRDLATRLGAVAAATPGDAAAAVAEASQGRGADVVVEAAGTAATWRQAVELVRVGGEVVAFGTITSGDADAAGGAASRAHYEMYRKELVVRHPRAARPADYARGIELAASGVVELAALVTHRFRLAEAREAFAAARRPGTLKVLMEPGPPRRPPAT